MAEKAQKRGKPVPGNRQRQRQIQSLPEIPSVRGDLQPQSSAAHGRGENRLL